MSKPIVLIMAAGQGTRMKSKKAKVLHEVCGQPMIHWAIDTALSARASKVVAIIGHQADIVGEVIAQRFTNDSVTTALQTEQKGTGHAVACGLSALTNTHDDDIVVILTGDAPLIRPQTISELTNACDSSPSGMALLAVTTDISVPYGRLVRDGEGRLEKIVEEKDATPEQKAITELNLGFYAIRYKHLRKGIDGLDDNNAQGEFYLTDLAEAAYSRGGAQVVQADFDECAGINNRMDLARAEAAARLRINAEHMEQGVTFLDPTSTHVGAHVRIGQDVTLGAGVILRGNTEIGAGSFIDAGCVLTNATVGENTTLKPYSVLLDASVGNSAQIGPFTHCRPGTKVDDEAKLGNFVETKNTHMMAGSKANHLAYLGDASVGQKANIGAGTITCNYDGFSKHKTTIEQGAFIGSDSQLVAPVTVGRDAYVGSGTTVTKDVPRASLALSRTKQVNVDGWAERFRSAQEKRKK